MYRQLQAILATLGGQTPTSVRAVLDRFYPCLAPDRASRPDPDFPIEYRPHLRNKDCSIRSGHKEVLCFHVARAVLAYYELVREKGDADTSAIDFLQALADVDVRDTVVIGNDQNGYRLVTRESAARLRQKEADKEQAEIDALNDVKD